VQVDARIIGEGPTTTELRRFDVQVERHRPDLGRAQYLVPSAALGSFAELPGIRWLQAPSYAMSQTGSLLTEGDVALGSASAASLMASLVWPRRRPAATLLNWTLRGRSVATGWKRAPRGRR
jgi:hypothetical protein